MRDQLDELRFVLAKFVEAFNNLDWQTFTECFTEDATVFMAYTEVPVRTTVAAAFGPFFERVRAMRPAPPYLNISPEDLEIEVSSTLALATFHLRGLNVRPAGEVGRRTAVFRRERGIWKMCHLHVSAAWSPST